MHGMNGMKMILLFFNTEPNAVSLFIFFILLAMKQ